MTTLTAEYLASAIRAADPEGDLSPAGLANALLPLLTPKQRPIDQLRHVLMTGLALTRESVRAEMVRIVEEAMRKRFNEWKSRGNLDAMAKAWVESHLRTRGLQAFVDQEIKKAAQQFVADNARLVLKA